MRKVDTKTDVHCTLTLIILYRDLSTGDCIILHPVKLQ